MYTMISETLLHLSLIADLSPLVIKQLFELMLEPGVDLYSFTTADFCALGYPVSVAQKIVEGLQDRTSLENVLAQIELHKVNWTTLADDTYPALLWHIHEPPPVLYWQGRPVWNEAPTLAVVGARKGTAYGRQAIEAILGPCIDQGMVIVSGGALGIDAMAHDFTVSQAGATVVVLGSGLLRPYPSSNKKLFLDVVASGGAVVSSFALEAEAFPWHFPARNRIIAGMSRGCLVVQAGEGSGSLITAKYALEEGRNVYAVPGPFDDPLSLGCHQIVQEGAQLVTCADHILADYPLKTGDRERQISLIGASKIVPVKKEKTARVVAPVRPTCKEKQENQGILAFCASAISIADLVEKTGKTESELKLELFELQLAGKVEQDFVGFWQQVR